MVVLEVIESGFVPKFNEKFERFLYCDEEKPRLDVPSQDSLDSIATAR